MSAGLIHHFSCTPASRFKPVTSQEQAFRLQNEDLKSSALFHPTRSNAHFCGQFCTRLREPFFHSDTTRSTARYSRTARADLSSGCTASSRETAYLWGALHLHCTGAMASKRTRNKLALYRQKPPVPRFPCSIAWHYFTRTRPICKPLKYLKKRPFKNGRSVFYKLF